MANRSDLKYFLYERSALDAALAAAFVAHSFHELRGRDAMLLREDFSGTFIISCEWIKTHPQRRAMALDLDPEPLSFGRRWHLASMLPADRGRIKPVRLDVATVTRPLADVALAENYSFYTFKTREMLTRYFTRCRGSLVNDGILMVAMGGGPGFISKLNERRQYKLTPEEVRLARSCGAGRGDISRFRYTWEQKGLDPLNNESRFSIHFDLGNGLKLRDAFEYDWRIWSVPEVREMLEAAGFKSTVVYWEQTDEKAEGVDLFKEQKVGPDDWSWNCYVLGLK